MASAQQRSAFQEVLSFLVLFPWLLHSKYVHAFSAEKSNEAYLNGVKAAFFSPRGPVPLSVTMSRATSTLQRSRMLPHDHKGGNIDLHEFFSREFG
jgi:hypothetical protein